MSAPEQNDQAWSDCPPGTISRLASTPPARRSMPFSTGLAVGVTACLLFAAFSMFFSGGEPSPAAGAMTCAQVMPLLNEYQAGQLDAKLAGEVELHLAKCASCQARLQSISAAYGSRDIARGPRSSSLLLASADVPRDRAWQAGPKALSR